MKVLRPYQQDTLDAVHRTLADHDSCVVVWPTGMGKTVLASKLMTGWERGNCLFLAHTTELIEQAAEKLAVEMDGLKPVVEMNTRGADRYTIHQGGLIVVGSVQSMYRDRRLEKYAEHPFGLIVVDECHRATGAIYRKVIDFFRARNKSLKVVGLTATPQRADGTSLGLIFESVAYQISINSAIDDGWLVPIRQDSIVIEGLDFTNLKTRINTMGERDFTDEELERIISEEQTVQAFARAIIDLAGGRSTLVFTPGVQSAHLLASVFNRHRQGCAAAVDGETPRELRVELIKDFKAGTTQFLCNAQVLTEGFDSPHCACVAMCRPTKSIGRYVQMLGRGLRPLPGVVDGVPEAADRKLDILTSDKPNCLILDFAGNSEFKLVDVWDVLGGNYDPVAVALAEEEGEGKNVSEDLEKAKMLRLLQLQWEERKPIVADDVTYTTHGVDPFGGGPGAAVASDVNKVRGGATDGQVGLLVKLGVPRETAERYSRRQAHAVIDSISKTRCTDPQAKVLRKAGVDPAELNMDAASRVIDALAANGWRPLAPERVEELKRPPANTDDEIPD